MRDRGRGATVVTMPAIARRHAAALTVAVLLAVIVGVAVPSAPAGADVRAVAVRPVPT